MLSYTMNKYYKFYITVFIVVLFFITTLVSVGFSALNQNLNISGDVDYEEDSNLLYNVLKKSATVGTYAREYTGDHHDSFTDEPLKKIYYWYGSNDTNGIAIQNKFNVIFGGFCWQMIRTTDTGGVKLIYNGEVSEGKCLDDRGRHIGYFSGTVISLSSSSSYGTSYIYNTDTGKFYVSGDISSGTVRIGQYTCNNYSASTGCNGIYYVVDENDNGEYIVLGINASQSYSSIGYMSYSKVYDSPAGVGYMFNKTYHIESTEQRFYVQDSFKPIYSDQYYSDSIEYNHSTNQYTLVNPQRISALDSLDDVIGKYMMSDGNTTVGDSAIYILKNNSGYSYYYKRLTNGNLDVTFMVGDSYIDNGDNTYTLNNPTLVSFLDWINGASSNYKSYYVCYGTNSTCSNLMHIPQQPSSISTEFNYWSTEQTYKYSQDVIYNGNSYTLTGDIKTIWDLSNSSELSKIYTHHYTCLSLDTTCSQVNYVNIFSNNELYYIVLHGVNNISEALNEMLYANDVNKNDSYLKKGIELWYKQNLIDYSEYLEDTIFCNDRTIYAYNGWNPNGGNITSTVSNYLQFRNHGYVSSFNCPNETDKFSIHNEKAKLNYPVGLLTYPESRILNNDNIRKSGSRYYLISPQYFGLDRFSIRYVTSSGGYSTLQESSSDIRPVISLKSGVEYTSGDGSKENPYIIE